MHTARVLPIPIFSFPPDVAEKLLKHLGNADLFHLSQASTRAYHLVQDTILIYKPQSSLTVKIGPTSRVILACGQEETVEWRFYGKRDAEQHGMKEEKRILVEVGGIEGGGGAGGSGPSGRSGEFGNSRNLGASEGSEPSRPSKSSGVSAESESSGGSGPSEPSGSSSGPSRLSESSSGPSEPSRSSSRTSGSSGSSSGPSKPPGSSSEPSEPSGTTSRPPLPPKTLSFTQKSPNTYGSAPYSIQDLLLFTQHISQLFNATTNLLEIEPSKIHHLDNILSVEMLRTSRQVTIKHGTVTPEELHRVLEGFQGDMVRIESNFRIRSTPALKSASRHVVVDCCAVTEGDVNRLLYHWIHGHFRNTLNFFLVRRFDNSNNPEVYVDSVENWNMERIAEGFTSSQRRRPSAIRRSFEKENDGKSINIRILNAQDASNLIIQEIA